MPPSISAQFHQQQHFHSGKGCLMGITEPSIALGQYQAFSEAKARETGHRQFMASRLSLAEIAERFVYRIAGLPVALAVVWKGARSDPGDAAAAIDAAYASRYWRPGSLGEWLELGLALVLWPFAVPAA